jgi:hypothetical protein
MPLCGTSGHQIAMAVFVDHTECAWLRPLKRGFRHCFVALRHPNGWVICDSLKDHIEIALVNSENSYELAHWYATQGHRVLVGRAEVALSRGCLPVTPLTCVSVAMRVLAIRPNRVWTPWQLFQHLLQLPEPWVRFCGCQVSSDWPESGQRT